MQSSGWTSRIWVLAIALGVAVAACATQVISDPPPLASNKRLQGFAFCFLVFLSILLFHSTTQAATFCVSSAGGLLSALATAGSNGQEDVIQVVQGTYKGSFIYASTEAFGLTIEGGYVAGCTSRVVDPANTVLDGMGAGRVLKLSSDQEVDFVIDGLTLQNEITHGGLFASTEGDLTLINNTISNNSACESSAGWGGGVYVNSATTVNLVNNTISGNSACGTIGGWGGGYGGGIYVSGATTVALANNTISGNAAGDGGGGGVYVNGAITVTLTNNTISSNAAGDSSLSPGGGISISDATTVTLTNNTISSNSVKGFGGGISVSDATTVTLTNNTISGNAASRYYGGGVSVSATTVTLTNNTITKNSASDAAFSGGGIGGGVWLTLFSDSDSADIYNNIIWNNSAGALGDDLYLNNDGDNNSVPSTVNLFNNDFDQSAEEIFIQVPFVIDPSNLNNLDPLFVDAINGDYHLQVGSPVINMGNNNAPGIPDTDKDGNLRIAEGVVDMGAYEFGAEPAFILNVSKAGPGSGTVTSSPAGVNCGSDCSGAYSFGTVVTLTATADSGSTFEGWSGDCSGTGSCVVSMTADRSVTATFSAGPMLSVSPTSLNFGEVEVNSSKDLTFAVTNSGGETLMGSVTTSSPFSIVSNSSFSLTAKTSQTVTVRFSPTTIGAFVGQVSISSNGGDATVTVTGTGVGIPVLSVTPTVLDFGEVQIGCSSDLTFTVTNIGTGTLEGSASTSAPFSIVSGGTFSLGAGASQIVTVRFSPTSATTFLSDASVSSNGGDATVTLNGTGTEALICGGAADDYDGDGEADLAVLRALDNGQLQWLVDTNKDGVTDIAVNYGLITDEPVPADYDGDGITDFAVIRGVGDGFQWIIDTNKDGIADIKVNYGLITDEPLPADYDGDGVTDLAVIRVLKRSGQLQWIIDTNRDSIADIKVNYGLTTDEPVPADYDGDGITDFAVLRGVALQWQWIIDTNKDGVTDIRINYGLVTDEPAPADYDGDSITDLTVIRAIKKGGQLQWIIDTNKDGVADIRVNYGLATDEPLPADYDGDHITDLAIIRALDNGQLQWIIDTNKDGVADIRVNYGLITDEPIT